MRQSRSNRQASVRNGLGCAPHSPTDSSFSTRPLPTLISSPLLPLLKFSTTPPLHHLSDDHNFILCIFHQRGGLGIRVHLQATAWPCFLQRNYSSSCTVRTIGSSWRMVLTHATRPSIEQDNSFPALQLFILGTSIIIIVIINHHHRHVDQDRLHPHLNPPHLSPFATPTNPIPPPGQKHRSLAPASHHRTSTACHKCHSISSQQLPPPYPRQIHLSTPPPPPLSPARPFPDCFLPQ